MLFEFGKYTLDIDVARTRAFYAAAPRITEGCDCQGCRNFVSWAASLSAEPKYALERIGIALEKAPEAYVNGPNDDGTLFYGGFFHLCGSIVRGKDPWVPCPEGGRIFDEDAFVPLAENFQAAFTEDIALLEKDFPTPVIQMEILANIPFVLGEPCDWGEP